MDKALVNNHLKDIMTFLKEDYEAYKEKRVKPICPYCSNTLYIYGRSSLKRNCRFQHYSKDKCRTKKSKSANLPDFSFDNSQIIKALGDIENLKRIFVVSRDILKSYKFPVKDFMELLIYPALKENVFSIEVWKSGCSPTF